MTIIKYLLYLLLFYCGATRILFSLIQRVTGNKYAVILRYHHIFRGMGSMFSLGVSDTIFEEQVVYLKKHFNLTTLESLVNELENGPSSSKMSVVLTFDDGFKDNYELALPVVKKHNAAGKLFVPTECVEKGQVTWTEQLRIVFGSGSLTDQILIPTDPPHKLSVRTQKEALQSLDAMLTLLKELPEKTRRDVFAQVWEQFPLERETAGCCRDGMMDWAMVRECQDNGLTIGSHGQTHAIATRLDPTEFQREAKNSKREIEKRTGVPCLFFSYPNGIETRFNEQTKEILLKTHYRAAVTSANGFVKKGDNLYELKRMSIANLPLFITMNQILTDFFREIMMDRKSNAPIRETQES